MFAIWPTVVLLVYFVVVVVFVVIAVVVDVDCVQWGRMNG